MTPGTEALRAADPVLGALIDAAGEAALAPRTDRPPPGEHYAALVRTIAGQQLSVRRGPGDLDEAARAVRRTATDAAGGPRRPTRRSCGRRPGFSRAKVSYLRSLAEHVLSGRARARPARRAPDEEVIAELVAVRGIGEWSAHMFLMFQLDRPDVLASGDLGMRRAVQLAYGLEALPAPAELVRDGRGVAAASDDGVPVALALARATPAVAPQARAASGRRRRRRPRAQARQTP